MEEIVSDEEKKRRSRKARAMNKARALQAIQRPVEERKPTKLADIRSRKTLTAVQSDPGDGSHGNYDSYDSTQSDPGPGAPTQADIRREARDARLRKIMDKKRMRLMSIQTASERAAGGVKISPSGPGPALAEIFDSIMRPADLPASSDPRGLEQFEARMKAKDSRRTHGAGRAVLKRYFFEDEALAREAPSSSVRLPPMDHDRLHPFPNGSAGWPSPSQSDPASPTSGPPPPPPPPRTPPKREVRAAAADQRTNAFDPANREAMWAAMRAKAPQERIPEKQITQRQPDATLRI